jgi:glycosyltransferase involved in cell wall biosynthesis
VSHFLFITTTKSNGGSEFLWLEAASRALEQGNRVSVVYHHDTKVWPELDQLLQKGATLVTRPTVPKRTILRRILWRITGNLKPHLQWWFKQFPKPPDIICVNQGGSYCASNMPGLVQWLNGSGTPFVLICHSHRAHAFPPEIYREELQECFCKANKACFVAQENFKAAERYLGMNLGQCLVVQNPLKLQGTESSSWPAATYSIRMACVARLEVKDKGQDLLLDALSDPVWKTRNFQLDLYGNGPDRVVLEDLIKLYDLGDKVRIAGFESNIRKIWNEHQLLVLPSLSEGTPISLIEAQICGRASLVTRVDGNPEWVEEGRTGFLAEAPTMHHLRLALERAWENRHRWREMGEAAREACLAKRDPDPAGTLLRLLCEATKQPRTEG